VERERTLQSQRFSGFHESSSEHDKGYVRNGRDRGNQHCMRIRLDLIQKCQLSNQHSKWFPHILCVNFKFSVKTWSMSYYKKITYDREQRIVVGVDFLVFRARRRTIRRCLLTNGEYCFLMILYSRNTTLTIMRDFIVGHFRSDSFFLKIEERRRALG